LTGRSLPAFFRELLLFVCRLARKTDSIIIHHKHTSEDVEQEIQMTNSSDLNALTLQLSKVIKDADGFLYRDLNKNGSLDVYEDPRQPVEARIEDLLRQMTVAEKAGMLFINGSVVNDDGSIEGGTFEDDPKAPLTAKAQMIEQKMNHFNLWAVPNSAAVAKWSNNIQLFAEETRLGIPITTASDPRNHFSNYIFDLQPKDFSQWCSALGLAAIGDAEFVKHYIHYVRQEYLAVGIRMSLHPQIDLATEPRWPRISGTFGEDAHLSAKLGKAYIEAFQGEALGPDSVACMTKHFPGGGPQNEGLDSHFEIHKGQVYPGDNFDYHLIPFEAAFEAKTAAIMPYYGVPMDQTDENVAMSYNKAIITDLLRGKYEYDGVVCTDWGLIKDQEITGTDAVWPARAWGVEHLSEKERVKKILDAGVDQFGGESCPNYVVELVEGGEISEERIDQSVRRLLRMKFQLGLFDNPFTEPGLAAKVFGNPETIAAGMASQARAMTLLKNEDNCLPLQGAPKLYVENMDETAVAAYAEVVSRPEEADFAILRLSTPWYPVESDNPIARDFHHGDLDFKGEEKAAILGLLRKTPTIVVIGMDRPAVIPEISAAAKGLLVEFGASDEAVLNVIFGKAQPQGRLPFELPSSMEAVRKQKADVPYDSEDPLYSFGFGLSY
jgi:beta-glucosidase